MHKGQAERLFPLLEEVLSEAGKNWQDLDAIGVCVGPGNFTGVRISVASARGLSLSLGIPAVGVSKLEAMAYGTNGPVASVLDARRDRIYLQRFQDASALGEPEMMAFSDIYNHMEKGAVFRVIADEGLDLPDAQSVEAIVSAVARITMARYQQELPRPAPLYLRAADAAPPSDPPVVILP
jgi:tRNA threonylcarbamoyl adenosine modification protein YeaZ